MIKNKILKKPKNSAKKKMLMPNKQHKSLSAKHKVVPIQCELKEMLSWLSQQKIEF